MKKIITGAILSLLVSASIFANNPSTSNPSKYSYENLYHEFSTVKGAEAVNIGDFLIGLPCLLADDINYDYIKDLKKLAILDVSGSPEMIKTEFRNSIDKIDDMELLMEASDNSDNLRFFIKRDKETISQLLIVETQNPCIICINCNMNTKELNNFTAKLNN